MGELRFCLIEGVPAEDTKPYLTLAEKVCLLKVFASNTIPILRFFWGSNVSHKHFFFLFYFSMMFKDEKKKKKNSALE